MVATILYKDGALTQHNFDNAQKHASAFMVMVANHAMPVIEHLPMTSEAKIHAGVNPITNIPFRRG